MTNYILILSLITCSLVLNLILGYKIYTSKKEKPQNKDLRILSDLMSGGSALIKITRVAPEEYFVRSPRDLM